MSSRCQYPDDYGRDSRSARDRIDTRGPREHIDLRGTRPNRDGRDGWDPRDPRDPRDLRDIRDPRDPRDIRDPRDATDPFPGRMGDWKDMGPDSARMGNWMEPTLLRGEKDIRMDSRMDTARKQHGKLEKCL
jgi:hypothetical protein